MKAAIRRAENWESVELFVGNAAPACCQTTTALSRTHLHTHLHAHLHAHTHTLGSQRRLWRERERGREGQWGRGRDREGGMLRSKLHFSGRPQGGQLQEQLTHGFFLFSSHYPPMRLEPPGDNFNGGAEGRHPHYDLFNNRNINVGKKIASAVPTAPAIIIMQ